jgi:hypothetical protein
MSSSPAPPDPRTAPLDAEEQALAQALRGLPAAAPSAELDARVLAMARAALAQPPRSAANSARRPRRRALWWMSSAAGAVLAAGIGWQLGQDAGGLPSASAPAPQRAQMRAAEPEQQDALLDVEIIRRSAPPSSPAPAPAASTEAEVAPRPDRSAERSAMAAAPVAPPSPAALMPTQSAAAPSADPLREQTELVAPEPAPSENPSAANSAADEVQTSDLDRVVVTGTRVDAARQDADGFPPLASDARLPPELWLERIRARRAAGQSDAARRSLKVFVRSYPYLVVPDDLRSLLNESP